MIKELYDKVIDVRIVNNRVISLHIVFQVVVSVVCAYAPESGKSM